MGLGRATASMMTGGLVSPWSHEHRTARNTKKTVRNTAAIQETMRRQQLVEQGLIGFNATDGEVAAVEARLRREQSAAERAEFVGAFSEVGSAFSELRTAISDKRRQRRAERG